MLNAQRSPVPETFTTLLPAAAPTVVTLLLAATTCPETFNVPVFTTVGPVYGLLPASVIAPEPDSVIPPPKSATAKFNVSVLGELLTSVPLPLIVRTLELALLMLNAPAFASNLSPVTV